MNTVISRLPGLGALALTAQMSVQNACAQDRTKNPQYGFAHRVNTAEYIEEVLDGTLGAGDSPARGIEFDVFYSGVYSGWFVSHGDAVITPGVDPTLTEWLQELKRQLDTGKYNQSFCALFVDVKTPNITSIPVVMDLVRQYVPPDVAVIYDMQGIENFETTTTGYDALKAHGLMPNEGVGCWALNVADVDKYYNIIKRDQIQRAIIDHGYFTGQNDDVLTEMNKTKYHDIRDPYRFKKVLSWTYTLQSTMEKYMNPANPYHMDGLLVGRAASEYDPTVVVALDDFDDAIDVFSATQRRPERRDFATFWERSGSDYVSGDLIHVNNVDGGARQTGAKYQPYVTLADGVASAKPGGRIVLSSVSNFSGTFATPYTGGTRISRQLRLEKAPGAGTVKITQ